MAHMQPVAEYLVMYHVETNHGTELVPEDVCGDTIRLKQGLDSLLRFVVGTAITDATRREGWYGRLSAPGYLDCTEWDGPYDTADEALCAVKEAYGVKDNGDDEDWSEVEG